MNGLELLFKNTVIRVKRKEHFFIKPVWVISRADSGELDLPIYLDNTG